MVFVCEKASPFTFVSLFASRNSGGVHPTGITLKVSK